MQCAYNANWGRLYRVRIEGRRVILYIYYFNPQFFQRQNPKPKTQNPKPKIQTGRTSEENARENVRGECQGRTSGENARENARENVRGEYY